MTTKGKASTSSLPAEAVKLASDGRKLHTGTIGDKAVEMVALRMDESMELDQYVKTWADGGMNAAKVYAIGSLRFIDGEPVFPLGGDLQFKRVLQKFSANEGFLLAGFYSTTFGTQQTGDELKNESSDPA